MSTVFALCDCNNFYASCERVFRPDLAGKPIVILSNNDGCVIARSAEAKQLGIAMGAAYYQLKKFLIQEKVYVFSSNYSLYGDMSARVMTVLTQHAPRIEVYSIDECFADLTGISTLQQQATIMRQAVLQQTGIPISVGIAPTKTLAKLANHLAKKNASLNGVFILNMDDLSALSDVAVREVWGIGRRLENRLHDMAIHTAYDLAQADLRLLRQRFGVVVERTARELNGLSCLSLEAIREPRQQIIASRSFGKALTTQADLQSNMSSHVARATQKLRRDGLQVRIVRPYIETGRFRDEPQYCNSYPVVLSESTDDIRLINKAAQHGLAQIYRSGYRYAKAGVMLLELVMPQSIQPDLFTQIDVRSQARSQQLLLTLDAINQQFGRGTVRLAQEGFNTPGAMHRDFLSPSYTTCWDDLRHVC